MANTETESLPTSVRWAVWLLWISAGLVVLLTLVAYAGVGGLTLDGVAIATNLVTIALLVFVALKVQGGRGWVRWFFVAIYVLGSLAFVVGLLLAPHVYEALPGMAKASAVVQFVIQTAALVLMFTSSSRQWFRLKRSASAP